jgi:hypothetical protein
MNPENHSGFDSIKLKPGLSSYAYTWAVGVPGQEPDHPLTAFDLVNLTFEAGMTVLQIADNLPLHLLPSGELEKLRLYSLQKGISIEVGTRRLDDVTLGTYLAIASVFGSPFLRIVIDDGPYRPSLPEIIILIRHALPEMKKLGIRLAIENHDRLSCRQFVEIIDGTDPDWVGICLDTVNSLGAGEGLETVVDRLAPLAINFHVKEFNIRRADHKMGFLVEGALLGEGMLPLESIIPMLGRNCKTAILEQWTPPAGSIAETIRREQEWAFRSAQYLKSMLEKYYHA